MTAAMTDDNKPEPALGWWEEEPVWGSELVVRGLEGGLRKAVETEPVLVKRRQRVTIVVDCFADEISFVPTEGPGKAPGLNRRAVCKAGLVTIVDRSVVAKALEDQQRKNDEAEARKAMFDTDGQPHAEAMPGDGADDEPPLSEAEAKVAEMFGADGAKRRGRSKA
jgi:hypothetical protein